MEEPTKLPQIILNKWGPLVELGAEIAGASAAAILRRHPDFFEVLEASASAPFMKTGEKIPYGDAAKNFCVEACLTGKRLAVQNARNDPRWKNGKPAKAGFIACLSVPVFTPDGGIFGAICIVDNKAREFSGLTINMLERFADMIAMHLDLFQKNTELESALREIRTLQGLIPICAKCKKIRNEKGFWEKVEHYIEKHSEVKFSHCLCNDCADKLYGMEKWYREGKEDKTI